MEAAELALSAVEALLTTLSCPPLQQMFTMQGYQSELESLKKTVSTVTAVLRGVQSVDEEKLSDCDRDLIERLKEAVYDADDLLDEFATLAKLKEANKNKVQCLFSRFKELKVAYSMSREVKFIRQKLAQIVDDAKLGLSKVDRQPMRKREETYAYVNENTIVGRDGDRERIVNMLMDPNIQGDASVLAIVGMGGLGKTTLAQLVYNDKRIQKEFPLTYWVCVSDQDERQFSIKTILPRIYKEATRKSNIGDLSMTSLVEKCRNKLNQNKYLLILDDVWTEDRSECNKLLDILIGSGQVAKRGSRIVVTTRSKITATVMGCNHPYVLQELSDESSCRLLFKITSNMEQKNWHDLLKMGEDIVKKCANVPLAIEVVGSFLYGQNEDTWQCIQQNGLSAIPEDKNLITPILKFSYNHLSASLKICFKYCATFPKDSVLSKEMVISFWLAHDYVEDEVVAERYFNILVQRCFFQDIHEDDDEGEITYKIHELMHDMAHQIAGKEISIATSSTANLDKNIRHLYDAAPWSRTKDFMSKSKIRSYIISDEETSDNIRFPVSTLLTNWRSLRTLELNITYLPNTIGELLHLRSLKLHGNKKLKKLPKSLTKLINLQTLFLCKCNKLEELPEDFSKLTNLRTLRVPDEADCGLRCMPLGMETMASLMHLNKFILGNSSTKRGVRLEDLRVPRNLTGFLKIHISPNYKHCQQGDGGGGYLCNTQYLKSISIEFPYGRHGGERMGNDDDDDLEDFQPHSNLKKLRIICYLGLTIPSWAREDGLATSLPNLVNIVLMNCNGLKELPWLGKLQHLKTLQLDRLKNLEYMENKRWSTNISSSSDGAASSSMAVEIFFPSLKNLELFDLPKLKGWWRGSSGSGTRDGSVLKGGQQLPSFPCLSHVKIAACPNLRSIPLGPAVETLILQNSGIMEEDEDQKAVARTSSNDSGNSGSDDPKIKEIETDNINLPALSFDATGNGMPWRCLAQCLCFLELRYLPKVVELPKGMRYLTALQSLKIVGLPLKDLPQWIACLPSLHSLEITECEHLESLPEALGNLTSLIT